MIAINAAPSRMQLRSDILHQEIASWAGCQKGSFLEHPPPGVPLVNLYLKTDEGVVDVLSNVLGVGDFARLQEKAVGVVMFGR
jgi:hypothetical protein